MELAHSGWRLPLPVNSEVPLFSREQGQRSYDQPDVVGVGVSLPFGVSLGGGEGDGVNPFGVRDGVGVFVLVAVGVGVRVREGVNVGEGVMVGVSVIVGVSVGAGVSVGSGVSLGVGRGVFDGMGVALGRTVGVGLRLGVSVAVGRVDSSLSRRALASSIKSYL